MAKLASTTYGDALFELALEEKNLDEIFSQVSTVLEAFKENPDIIKLLNHPKIDKEEKKVVVKNIFEGRVSNNIIGLVSIVVEKEHCDELEGILEYFIGRYKEYKKIGIAYVRTAVALNDTQKKQLVKKLLDTTKYTTFEVNYTVDESLIGGMVIRIGDKVVDSSIKTKLYDLTTKLSNVQLAS